MKVHSLPIKGIIFNHYHPGNIMEEDNIATVSYTHLDVYKRQVRSLSGVGVGYLRGAVLSTRGPGWTDRWWTGWLAKAMAG